MLIAGQPCAEPCGVDAGPGPIPTVHPAERAVDVAGKSPAGLWAPPEVHPEEDEPAGLVVKAVPTVEGRRLDRVESIACRVGSVVADVTFQDAGNVPDAMDARDDLFEIRLPVRRLLDAGQGPNRRVERTQRRVDPICFRNVSGPHSITSLAASAIQSRIAAFTSAVT